MTDTAPLPVDGQRLTGSQIRLRLGGQGGEQIGQLRRKKEIVGVEKADEAAPGASQSGVAGGREALVLLFE
jgi:hypothetical protein